MRVDSQKQKVIGTKTVLRWCPNYFPPSLFPDQRVHSFFILFFYVTSVKTKKYVSCNTQLRFCPAPHHFVSQSSSCLYMKTDRVGAAEINPDIEALWRKKNKTLDWNQYHAVLIFSSRSNPPSTTSFNQWGRQDAKINQVNIHVQTSKNTRRKKTEISQSEDLCSFHWVIVQGYLFWQYLKVLHLVECLSSPRSSTLRWDEKETSQKRE